MESVKLDFTEDVLRHCGGRLTTHDADLLHRSAWDIKPKNILEIGSMDGCSSMILGAIAREIEGSKLQCIEPSPKQKWRANIERLNLQPYIDMIFGMSPWVYPDRLRLPIDYLLIDGDHRTRWAIVDYHYFFRYVRVGGRIAFHDWWDQHDAGTWVREAVEIILRDDSDLLKMVEETRNKRGLIVFEKIGDRNWYR